MYFNNNNNTCPDAARPSVGSPLSKEIIKEVVPLSWLSKLFAVVWCVTYYVYDKNIFSYNLFMIWTHKRVDWVIGISNRVNKKGKGRESGTRDTTNQTDESKKTAGMFLNLHWKGEDFQVNPVVLWALKMSFKDT